MDVHSHNGVHIQWETSSRLKFRKTKDKAH